MATTPTINGPDPVTPGLFPAAKLTREQLEGYLWAAAAILQDSMDSSKKLSVRGGNQVFEQVFKNIDDVLWKEAGCTTELDTEQTSWLLFLKYLDDLERERAMEAELVGKSYEFLIDEPHRWSSWAAPKKADGSFDHDTAATGDDLIRFVNNDLFPYLEGLKQRASGPDTIECKMGEIANKFRSRYSLRDALELMDALHFRSQQDKHGAIETDQAVRKRPKRPPGKLPASLTATALNRSSYERFRDPQADR